jgi:hypothetical protein
MKKILVIGLLVMLLTGCTAVRINTNSIDNILKVILTKDNNLYNRIGKGYKYYIPRGVSYIDTNDLNEKLYCDGNYYYLYIDAVSYYYDIKHEYKENKEAYYSKKLENEDKKGYLEINYNDKSNKYFIEFMYNYGKIEALVEKQDIEQVVLNASYILSTVKFNNNIIKLSLGDNNLQQREEQYDIFKIKTETDSYILTPSEEEEE